MRLHELTEGRNSKCIVIDVQPDYTGLMDGDELPWIDDLMKFLNKQGQILMFVNAEDQQMSNDTIADIQMYWEDSGFDPHNWNKVTIVDKGYGYFRGWDGLSESTIIKTIREMYKQRITDSRDLFDGDNDAIANFIGHEFSNWMIGDSIGVEWTSVAQLKRFNGAYLMGGGRDECLKEVTLLMNAFNIKYKTIEEFIYG